MASLQYALQHCHPRATSNRRAILFYLIPLAMLHARLPSPQLLAECCFPSYDILTQVGPARWLRAMRLPSPACPAAQTPYLLVTISVRMAAPCVSGGPSWFCSATGGQPDAL